MFTNHNTPDNENINMKIATQMMIQTSLKSGGVAA